MSGFSLALVYTLEVTDHVFLLDLIDDPALCGAFCVWLAHDIQNKMWLSGRWLNAKWDVDELCAMKEKIVNGGMLKARMVVQ